MEYLVISFALGFFSYICYWHTATNIKHRINSGMPVKMHGEIIGRVVVIRYNGSKKYGYVDHHHQLNSTTYWTKDEATDAICRDYVNYTATQNAKQITFPRRSYA